MAVVLGTRVNQPADTAAAMTAEHLRALHEARARAELALADTLAPGADAVAWRGALLAQVAVVKGLPGPAEAAGGAALSGPDGVAVESSLAKLGYPPDSAFFTLSRSEPGIGPERRAARLLAQLEAVDPLTILALDGEAAADVALAYHIEVPAFGVAVRVLGRRFVACDGLEESLGKPGRKPIVWAQIKAAAPEGPVY